MAEEPEFEPTEQDLLIIREWIAKMPHIVQDYDDQFLATFFKAAKGRIEKVKTLLENYNGLGCRYPKLLGHLDPLDKNLQVFLNANYIFSLPKKSKNGSLVCMLVPRNNPDVDLSNYNMFELYRYWHMHLLVQIWEKNLGNTKTIIVADTSNEKLARFKNFTLSDARDGLVVLEFSPIRLQGFHYINFPKFLEPLLNLAKQFMITKLLKRLYFHSTKNSLFETIPREYLPKEYGGCEASIRTLHDLQKKKIESYRDKLIETSDKMRKLDPLRPKSEDHYREMEGTFRQLHID